MHFNQPIRFQSTEFQMLGECKESTHSLIFFKSGQSTLIYQKAKNNGT